MNKVKFKVNIKIISLLVLLLAFLMLPFGQFEPTTAEGEYRISTEQGLKDWLQNTNNIQTNNPNAILTEDISINWGAISPQNAVILSGSILNGSNHTISIANTGGSAGSGTKLYYFGMFTTSIYGSLINTNFTISNNCTITIDYDSNKDNEGIFSGIITANLENGKMENCSLLIDKNIVFNESDIFGTINGTFEVEGNGSNHAGAIAGRLYGGAIIKNMTVIQESSSTITIHTNHGASNYNRWAMIASDSYKDSNGNVPQIVNATIERWGNLIIRDNSSTSSKGNYIYGIVIADMSTVSTNDQNHAVFIDGVIYNGVADVAMGNNDQIDFGQYDGGDFTYHYFVGRIQEDPSRPVYSDASRFYIKNVYSYVTLTNESSLLETGVNVIPSGYNLSFDINNEDLISITKTTNSNDSTFIYSISQMETNVTYDTFIQLSNYVVINKFHTETNIGLENILIIDGQIIDSAYFGFENSETIYDGNEKTAIIKINNQNILTGFTAIYSNNINASQDGVKAKCELTFPDTENGLFLHSNYYFIAKDNIQNLYLEMTINPAPLTITYTTGDVYTNNLSISGLVNGQQVTIDSAKYGNGSTSFDCLNNSTTKTISFTDGVIETNYAITQNGLEDLTFEVSPKTISISDGITVTNADGNNAVFSENVLTIYSKNYQTIELEYSQPVGYLNRVDLTSSEGHSFNISSSLNDSVMSNTISSDTENGLHYLEKIVLNESLQKVAVKIDIDTTLISNLTINGQRPVKYGDYLLIDADFGEELEFVVALLDDYQDYTISYTIGEQSNSIEGNSFKINALPQANNMLTISINMTAPSSQN